MRIFLLHPIWKFFFKIFWRKRKKFIDIKNEVQETQILKGDGQHKTKARKSLLPLKLQK